MTAVIGTNQVGLKNITSSTTVPENPTAKLMYSMSGPQILSLQQLMSFLYNEPKDNCHNFL